jgi:hypothetical protein
MRRGRQKKGAISLELKKVITGVSLARRNEG